MANRRMFSKKLINSGRFLRMPVSARLLYYELGMAADDDGIVEAFKVIRAVGVSEDDLNILVTKGFVTILDQEDLIVHIVDWNAHNTIRPDRYTPSVYKSLLSVLAGNHLQESQELNSATSDAQTATNGQPFGNQTATNGQPHGNQMATNGQPFGNHPRASGIGSGTGLGADSGSGVGEVEGTGEDGKWRGTRQTASSANSSALPEETPLITIPLNSGDEYPIFQNQYREWQELYPSVDVMQQLRAIRGWNLANPRKRKTKKGILSHIASWLSKEQNQAGWRKPSPSYSSGAYSPGQSEGTPDWGGGLFESAARRLAEHYN